MYGFRRDCSLCSAYMNTSNKKKKKRANIAQAIFDRIFASGLPFLEAFEQTLDRMEETYVHPASEEPRVRDAIFLDEAHPGMLRSRMSLSSSTP